jgi:sulfite reductase (NADPH) flavoprotein alpha-component
MSQPAATPVANPWSRTNPFIARISENRLLSKTGSAKDTRHLVVDIQGSGLRYSAGDCLGVFARNPDTIVDELIKLLKLDPMVPIANATGSQPLREILQKGTILRAVSKKFVKVIAERLPEGEKKRTLGDIVANEEAFDAYIYGRDFIDVLIEHPGVSLSAEELIGTINKAQPRLYSIASSGNAYPEHVHLTVAIVRYQAHNRWKHGFCSGFMADHAPVGSREVPVYVQPTKHFHLADDDKPIIMVGPGTGIAPFRAFLQERHFRGAKGKNWLFFGDQTRVYDYLYEEEFTEQAKGGFLTRLDLAFSRDQAHKVYVQDRMRENGAELWKWLQEGAYFYVCGDAKRMAKDVHQALIDIAAQHGGLAPDKATEYIEQTFAKGEKRYLKDVY